MAKVIRIQWYCRYRCSFTLAKRLSDSYEADYAILIKSIRIGNTSTILMLFTAHIIPESPEFFQSVVLAIDRILHGDSKCLSEVGSHQEQFCCHP